MVRSALLLLATLGTTLPYASAQQPCAVIATEQVKQLGELHDRAAHPLCDTANNYTQGVCESRETAVTDANETKLVRTLGAFYCLHLRYAGSTPKPGPLSFDGAEASWHLFREEVCQSVADQYAGHHPPPHRRALGRLQGHRLAAAGWFSQKAGGPPL